MKAIKIDGVTHVAVHFGSIYRNSRMMQKMIDSGTFLLNTDTGQVWHSQLELYQLLDRYEEVLVDICSKDPESIREEMIQQIQKTPSERLLEIRKQLRI